MAPNNAQWRQNAVRKGTWSGISCAEDGCESPVSAKGRCASHYSKHRRANGIKPPSCNPMSNRDRHLRHRYGISLNEYQQLIEDQEGKCAICRDTHRATNSPANWAGKLCVDHDHETGDVRGLLCNACNLAIGYCNTDEMLFNAGAYIQRHATKGNKGSCMYCLDLPMEMSKAVALFGGADTVALAAILVDVTKYCPLMHGQVQ